MAVGQAAERHGLREQLKRVDAEGASAVRVQIEDAPFAALMAWLVELQQSGLRAESATLERHANPGTVNARLLLRAQGA
jgi:general secretion pathway protein M